jgi:hypothetical protein
MKIILVCIIFAVALLTFGQSRKGGAVEEEIRRLNAQEVEALLQNDVPALKQLWSNDFAVTNPFNKFLNKQQVLGMTESGTLAFKSYDRHIEYMRVYGDTAVVAGAEIVVWAGKLPTAGQTSHLRFTGIWIKQGGRWQEVARHANIVIQQ